jgi:hypothetical protein
MNNNEGQNNIRRFYMRLGKRTVTVTYKRIEKNKFEYAFSANRVDKRNTAIDLYNKKLGKEIAEGRLLSGKHCLQIEAKDPKMVHLEIAKQMAENTTKEGTKELVPKPIRLVAMNYVATHKK